MPELGVQDVVGGRGVPRRLGRRRPQRREARLALVEGLPAALEAPPLLAQRLPLLLELLTLLQQALRVAGAPQRAVG